jgi:release factor glutamine methyltransferase
MTIQLAYKRLLAQLYELYDAREAANIADMVIEHVTGQRKIDRIMYKDLRLNEEQESRLDAIADELLAHRPVQYVLGEAWFMNMKFTVNESVLIPRPETEELVDWIITYVNSKKVEGRISIIDIGTGSGIIPIALKRKLTNAKVYAIDVSQDALNVAKQNAEHLQVSVECIKLDFLDRSQWHRLPTFDVIVSNPPYIRKSERAKMSIHVLQYEPNIALFVPDEDALIFYEAIGEFGKTHLKPEGSVFVEINEAMGAEVVQLFSEKGYKNVVIKKDMQGKDRLVKAVL